MSDSEPDMVILLDGIDEIDNTGIETNFSFNRGYVQTQPFNFKNLKYFDDVIDVNHINSWGYQSKDYCRNAETINSVVCSNIYSRDGTIFTTRETLSLIMSTLDDRDRAWILQCKLVKKNLILTLLPMEQTLNGILFDINTSINKCFNQFLFTSYRKYFCRGALRKDYTEFFTSYQQKFEDFNLVYFDTLTGIDSDTRVTDINDLSKAKHLECFFTEDADKLKSKYAGWLSTLPLLTLTKHAIIATHTVGQVKSIEVLNLEQVVNEERSKRQLAFLKRFLCIANTEMKTSFTSSLEFKFNPNTNYISVYRSQCS